MLVAAYHSVVLWCAGYFDWLRCDWAMAIAALPNMKPFMSTGKHGYAVTHRFPVPEKAGAV